MYTKKRQFKRNCLFCLEMLIFYLILQYNNILYVRNINNL